METPPELLEDNPSEAERAARLGRFAILEELGFFGEKTNIRLSMSGDGTFIGRTRRHFSNTFQNLRGCDAADIEVAAEMLGVFDSVFNVEASNSSKHLKDHWL